MRNTESYKKLKSGNLFMHQGYSAIKVLGFVVGIACCLLIRPYMRDGLSYDRYHECINRIHLIVPDVRISDGIFNTTHAILPMAPAPHGKFLAVLNAHGFSTIVNQ